MKRLLLSAIVCDIVCRVMGHASPQTAAVLGAFDGGDIDAAIFRATCRAALERGAA